MDFFSFCRVSGCFSPFFSLTQKRGGPHAAQTADKLFPGGLEGPQALQSGFVSPGFPRSLNRRGGRWPRPPLVSLPTFRSLCHLRWQQPTGLTLPSGAGRAGRACCRKQFLRHALFANKSREKRQHSVKSGNIASKSKHPKPKEV